MKRLKLFIENFLVYGVGGAVSKIVPLIMLPIVTRMLSTTHYGMYDLSNTIVSFGSAVALMGMYDAMFRLFFDKEDKTYQKEICSTALYFTLLSTVVVTGLLLLVQGRLALWLFGSAEYGYLVALSAGSVLVGSTNSIVSAPTRINNQRMRYLVANTVGPVITYGVAIPLILHGWYVTALPLANLISVATIEVFFGFANRQWFSPRYFNKQLLKPLLKFGVPLMPNILVYWVFNSCDKLMIAQYLSNAANGIYAAAGKLGQVSNLIYVAFAGGWQYFAFSTMKDEDQVKLTSNVFEYLGIISFICGVMMAALNNILVPIILSAEYASGKVVVPYLFLAPLLLMLFQTACNQFLVIKKTWPNVVVLSFGALLNVALNAVLIPRIGIEGAALATLAGYVTSVFIMAALLQRIHLLAISKRFLVCVLVTLAYLVGWRFLFQHNNVTAILLALAASACMAWLYKQPVIQLVGQLKKLLHKE